MDAATIVKRVRALSGITRKQLAELADLSPSTIGRIERGTLDPTWGTLTRILDATGYGIDGDTVVSMGDPTAIAAARPVLEALFESSRGTVPSTASEVLDTMTALAKTATPVERFVVDGAKSTSGAGSAPPAVTVDRAADIMNRWLARWARAGWLSEGADADDVVTLAISAGNAGKIARRNVARRVVIADDGWRELARRLGEAGIDYAVSGLVATRDDRATAMAVNPVIYVEDPSRAVEELGLEETTPGRGVLLIAPAGDELERVQVDGGVRFVSRAQGVLDAFAGSGREPDKAEDALRQLLAASA
jgi:transcriptional regulator with XRE-family HTH domain